MNYGELRQRLASISHRKNLTAALGGFVADATDSINNRLTLTLAPLVADADTNEILTNLPSLYIFAGMRSLYEFLNNGDNAIYYNTRFEEEISRYNITSPFASESLVITVGG